LKTDAMNDMSLSSLYRRLTSARVRVDVDATELVDALAPTGGADAERRAAMAAKLAASRPYARLARMLRELRPASEALAGKVNERRHAAHPARQRDLRPAAGARRVHAPHLRWASGIAACLAVVFGLWSWHGSELQSSGGVAMSTETAASKPDRIFTTQDKIFASSGDAGVHGHARDSDELFRGNFSRGG
jgi:hypothetical protein